MADPMSKPPSAEDSRVEQIVEAPNAHLASDCEVGLVITTYNRPRYLARTLRSLAAGSLEKTALVIIDDGSQSRRTLDLIRGFSLPGVPITKVFRKRRVRSFNDVGFPVALRFRKRAQGFGVHDCLRIGWRYLLDHTPYRYLANLDSDTLVRPWWLSEILRLHREQRDRRGPIIVTGYNSCKHLIRQDLGDHYVKESIGGVNMLFEADLFDSLIEPNLRYEEPLQIGWDWLLVRAAERKGYPLLCAKPSVIQHIGRIGRFSFFVQFDQALDFNG